AWPAPPPRPPGAGEGAQWSGLWGVGKTRGSSIQGPSDTFERALVAGSVRGTKEVPENKGENSFRGSVIFWLGGCSGARANVAAWEDGGSGSTEIGGPISVARCGFHQSKNCGATIFWVRRGQGARAHGFARSRWGGLPTRQVSAASRRWAVVRRRGGAR